MRFIRKLAKGLIIGTVVISLGAIIINFIILSLEADKVRTGIIRAKRLVISPEHILECQGLVTDSKEFPITGYQLRFISDTEFVVEAICVDGSKGPFVVSTHTLAYGVKKEVGYSGIFFRTGEPLKGEANIVLSFGLLRRVVSLLNGQTSSVHVGKKETISSGLKAASATCSGWGFVCCMDRLQVGAGSNQSQGVTDCRGQCFDRCLDKPIILSFDSKESNYSDQTRELSLKGKQSLVVFSYSVQDYDSQTIRATINFGDGQQFTTTNFTDYVSHTYTCSSLTCIYQATLSVIDSDGLDNSPTRLSTITIRQIQN